MFAISTLDSVNVYSWADHGLVRSLPFKLSNTIALSSDLESIFICTKSSLVKCSIGTGEVSAEIENNDFREIVLSPNSELLAACSKDGSLTVFRTSDLGFVDELIESTELESDNSDSEGSQMGYSPIVVRDISFSNDSSLIYGVYSGDGVFSMDVTTGERVFLPIRTGYDINRLDGTIVYNDSNGVIKRYDTFTQESTVVCSHHGKTTDMRLIRQLYDRDEFIVVSPGRICTVGPDFFKSLLPIGGFILNIILSPNLDSILVSTLHGIIALDLKTRKKTTIVEKGAHHITSSGFQCTNVLM
jgi:hypothetical protein